jgi:uncharacterized membrane protein YhiD involved in acid resistance
MKLTVSCLIVCIGSALIALCDMSSGGNPTRFVEMSVTLFGLIAGDLSLASAATIIFSGATGIAWGIGLYPVAVFGTLLVLISSLSEVPKGDVRSCYQIKIVCRLHSVKSVIDGLEGVSLRGFDKDPSKNLISLFVQPQLTEKGFSTWLEHIKSNPAVLDVRVDLAPALKN